jgi:hypothetical protein
LKKYRLNVGAQRYFTSKRFNEKYLENKIIVGGKNYG